MLLSILELLLLELRSRSLSLLVLRIITAFITQHTYAILTGLQIISTSQLMRGVHTYQNVTIVFHNDKITQQTNKEIVVSIPPKNFFKDNNNILPLSGISNSQTINCNENGYYSIFQSDRYGFNNDDNQWDKDYFEYILIGDSFAYGSCVNREENIAGNLSKIIGN